jgi:diphosphomevalonate decarboxylase
LKATDAVKHILQHKSFSLNKQIGEAFAPSNIALVKYWGKRDANLNLPNTSSLSISLGDKGTTTRVQLAKEDAFFLNGKSVDQHSSFYKRLSDYLDLFRQDQVFYFRVDTTSNIPVAAGLASSASGFSALALALNDLFGWELEKDKLSILARLGSGSASRSLWKGFVEWNKGIENNGMDSFSEPLETTWPEFRIGLHIITEKEKEIGSREAMNITTQTSPRYATWPDQVSQDLILMKKAIEEKNFVLLGKTAENNALLMHNTMLDATPKIDYSSQATHEAREKVIQLRKQGVLVYFTQDAGPNLKLLFLDNSMEAIKTAFPELTIIKPFS